jgi:DNA-binding transcriptional regulator YiaG
MAKAEFSKTLRDWRNGLELFQKEAADKLGVNLRSYQAWEVGEHYPNQFAMSEILRRMESLSKKLVFA